MQGEGGLLKVNGTRIWCDRGGLGNWLEDGKLEGEEEELGLIGIEKGVFRS